MPLYYTGLLASPTRPVHHRSGRNGHAGCRMPTIAPSIPRGCGRSWQQSKRRLVTAAFAFLLPQPKKYGPDHPPRPLEICREPPRLALGPRALPNLSTLLLSGCGLLVFCIIRVAQVDRGAANPAHLQSFRLEGSCSVGFVGFKALKTAKETNLMSVLVYCCLASVACQPGSFRSQAQYTSWRQRQSNGRRRWCWLHGKATSVSPTAAEETHLFEEGSGGRSGFSNGLLLITRKRRKALSNELPHNSTGHVRRRNSINSCFGDGPRSRQSQTANYPNLVLTTASESIA